MGLSYEAVPILWHFAFDFWLSGRVPVISVQSTRVSESQSYSAQRLLTAPGKGRLGEIPMDSKCFINFKTLHFNFK